MSHGMWNLLNVLATIAIGAFLALFVWSCITGLMSRDMMLRKLY